MTVINQDTDKEFGMPIMGEDISWCERVRAAGYNIYLDTGVKVKHQKTVALGWETS